MRHQRPQLLLAFLPAALAAVLFGAPGAAAQTPFSIGGDEYDDATDLATDPEGNVYLVGHFVGVMDADPGPDEEELESQGPGFYRDMFIAKYGPGGDLQWAFSVGGEDVNAHPFACDVDEEGNLYVSGNFTGTADFDPGVEERNLTTDGIANYDLFLAKYDTDGNLEWAFSVGGSGFDFAAGVEVGPDGAYITGSFEESVDFDTGAGTRTLISQGSFRSDAFVARYETDGTFGWAAQAGGELWDQAYAITIDDDGNTYIGGLTGSDIDADLEDAGEAPETRAALAAPAGTGSTAFSGGAPHGRPAGRSEGADRTAQEDPDDPYDPFLAKFNAEGDLQWAFRITRKNDGAYVDNVQSLASDADGNIYAAGLIDGEADFDPGRGKALLTPEAISARFVASYTSDGEYRWAFLLDEGQPSTGAASLTARGASDDHYDYFPTPFTREIRLTASDAGDVYVAGEFDSGPDFDPSSATFRLGDEGDYDQLLDLFLAAYDTDGDFLWAVATGTGDENAYAPSVALAEAGLYLAGTFEGEADFDPAEDEAWILESVGDIDAFLALYSTASGALLRAILVADAATTDEDTAVTIDVLDNDTTPGDEPALSITEEPRHGEVTINADGTLTYAPGEDFAGEDTFTYGVDDGTGDPAEATVTVTVAAVNDAPSAAAITSPEDNARLVVGGADGVEEPPASPSETMEIAWEEAVDPEGDDLTYTWQLSSSPAFNELLADEDVGEETGLALTLGTLAALLDQAGVALGDEVELFHRVVVSDGAAETEGEVSRVTLIRGTLVATEGEGELPQAFALHGAYPNPFNPETVIPFALPESGRVAIRVYDVLGREVARLADGDYAAGTHTVSWRAEGLPSGLYVVRMEAGGMAFTQTVMLMK